MGEKQTGDVPRTAIMAMTRDVMMGSDQDDDDAYDVMRL